jgi:serine protease Do
MWGRRRSGARLLGGLALGCAALAGAAIVSLATAGAARAQAAPGGGYMGVQLQDLDQGLRDSYGYRGPGGVLIADVADGSPAALGGMKRGDILIRLEGNTMDSAEELTGAVRRRSPGDRVALSVWRDGREVPLRVELGERPDTVLERRIVRRDDEGEDATEAPEAPPAPASPKAPKRLELRWQGEDSDEPIVITMPDADELQRHLEIVTARPRLGVELQDLDEELGAYFERPDGRGVLVTRVIKDTPAARAGMKAGDVIIELDGKSVDDAAELRRELADKEAGAVRVTVLRKGQRQSFTADLAAAGSPQMARRAVPQTVVRRYEAETRDELRQEMNELRREMRDLQRELESLRATAPKKSTTR